MLEIEQTSSSLSEVIGIDQPVQLWAQYLLDQAPQNTPWAAFIYNSVFGTKTLAWFADRHDAEEFLLSKAEKL